MLSLSSRLISLYSHLLRYSLSYLAFSYPSVVILWIVFTPYPALMDFTAWLYQSFISHALISGNEQIAEQFYFATYPIPNSFSQTAMTLLYFFLKPLDVGRLWISLYFLFWLGLGFLIFKSSQGTSISKGKYQDNHIRSSNKNRLASNSSYSVIYSSMLILVLFFTTTLGSSFWNGFINYQFSLLFFTAYLYLRFIKQKKHFAIIFLLSPLLFFTHFSSFCIFIGIAFIDELSMYSKIEKIKMPKLFIQALCNPRSYLFCLLILLPTAILSIWYFLGANDLVPQKAAKITSLAQYFMYKAYTLMKAGPFHNFILDQGNSFLENWPLLYWSGFVANFTFALCLSSSLIVFFTQVYIHKSKSWQHLRLHPLSLGLTICLGVYVILPAEFIIINLGERFLHIGIIIFLVLATRLYVLPRPLLYGMSITGFLLLPYYFFFLSWGIGRPQNIDFSSDMKLAIESKQEVDFKKRAEILHANTRYFYFNHRLYSYKELFPILEKQSIQENMPYIYSTSFLKHKKDTEKL